MPRIRSAKYIARRIDLQYFTRLVGMRRLRLILSVAFPAIGLVWFTAQHAVGSRSAYSSGPLSPAHAVLSNNCQLCHVRSSNYRAQVADQTCLSCHDAPAHSQKQTFTPACISCHIEHQGKDRLAETADRGCTVQCHSSLRTRDGNVSVVGAIDGFISKHPNFWTEREGATDLGTINLNHAKHLDPILRGPNGQVQMVCSDCHRARRGPDPWPFSVVAVQPSSQESVSVPEPPAQQRKRKLTLPGGGAYMEPIRYVNQCAACHRLEFSPLVAEPAPHGKPDVVHAFIVRKFTEYLARNPNAWNQPNLPVLPIASSLGDPPNVPGSPQQFIDQSVANAEALLWRKNCKLCHAVTDGPGGGLPRNVTAIVPVRWFGRAEFNHESHRMMKCESCHVNSPTSEKTGDINLPGIGTCRRCHSEHVDSHAVADGRCFECHSYHDWRLEKLTRGTLSLSDAHRP
jgi:hypothetical protein